MRKLRVLVIFVLIIGVVGAAAGFVVKKRMAAAKKATIVRVEVVGPGELVEFVSAPAELEPRSRVEISAKVSGRVVTLPYKVGERVTKGDPNSTLQDQPADCITAHCGGGREMLRQAVRAAGERAGILAVTVLTSLNEAGAVEEGPRPREAAGWRAPIRVEPAPPREALPSPGRPRRATASR